MKLLILVSILVPLYFKHFIYEFLCIILVMSMPQLWMSWSLPLVLCPSFLMDKLSVILIILSLWTSILMVLIKSTNKYLILNILLLLWSLVIFFSVSSFLSFFIFFEMSLIPTLCLIMGWGYQPERLEASYYFIFYTIFLSIPLLTTLLWMSVTSGSKYFYFSSLHEVCSGALGLLILSVFLIKLPMFLVHFWLPKAHVEAPVVGSMILAGVLLKTGGYGIARIFMFMKKTLVTSAFMTLGLVGMVYVCFVCLYCTDLKQVVAFSSVSHMNFMIVGLMMNSTLSYSGATIMMVSHGLCSSLMFMLIDLSYKRCNSRSILISKGFLMSTPILSAAWSLTILFNMGVPPSAGSLSELSIIAAQTSSYMHKIMFSLYLFFSAFYSMSIYVMINHGNSYSVTYPLKVKEALMILAHLTPLTSLTVGMKLMLM